ncbi:MAG: FAD:protein FMN transferase [Candidatus Cloacimonetes bacterium]|nr:FAD:protein FMN transferase [Candidatus Cloacimonadota bacterium]
MSQNLWERSLILLVTIGITLVLLPKSTHQPVIKETVSKIPIDLNPGPNQLLRFDSALMGSPLRLMVEGESENIQNSFSDLMILLHKLEATISSWRQNSDTDQLNRNAGLNRPITIQPSTYQLLESGKYWHQKTEGAFDITVGPLLSVYRQNRDANINNFSAIEILLPLIDASRIELTPPHFAYLPRKGMKVDLGGIGKGYAADFSFEYLKKQGYTNIVTDFGHTYRIELDSEISLAITHPIHTDQKIHEFDLRQGSVSTSSNRVKNHIIHPKTGLPVHDVIGVTVITREATAADVLSTAFMVMGLKKSLELLRSLPGVHALFVLKNDEIYKTQGFPQKTEKTVPIIPASVPYESISTQALPGNVTLDPYEISNREYIEFLLEPDHVKKAYYPAHTPENKNLAPRYYHEFRPALFLKTEAATLAPFDENTFRKPDHPVVGVDYFDAYAFCRYKNKRLPSLQEFQYFASDNQTRTWPWGNRFEYKKVNSGGEKWGEKDGHIYTAPIDSFHEGQSRLNHYHLTGNVMEWTEDGFLFGGGFRSNPTEVSSLAYKSRPVYFRAMDVGFRCASEQERQ